MNKVSKILISFLFMTLFCFQISAQRLPDIIGGDSGGSKQTWQDIMSNSSLKPLFPTVIIQGHLVDYNHLCIDQKHDAVRTKYMVQIKNHYSNRYFFNFLYEFETSSSFDCKKYNQSCVSEFIPRTKTIYVYKADVASAREVYFSKEYKLPACP
jgi:hypothetical protein